MDFFRTKDFDHRVERFMSQNHVPGLAVAVVEDDVTESKGYGVSSLESGLPCTGDTLFDIASASKSFTAAAVGMLVADNEKYPEVQYEAIMSSLLPDDFVMPGTGYTEGVTVEDILSHRSGMAGHDNSYTKSDTPRSVTRNLRNLFVAAPLRSRYMYCNMMYTVSTHLIEEKTKQSFSDFLEERIFAPLEMTSTSLQPSRAREKGHGGRIATGYRWKRNDKPSRSQADSSVAVESSSSSPASTWKKDYHAVEVWEDPEAQGAGSVLTSADDLIRWVRCFLRREEPITQEIYWGLVRMRTIVSPSPRHPKRYTSPALYAAGLECYHYRGHMVIGHDGCISGFASKFIFLPDLKFGLVILGNSEGATVVSSLICRLLMDVVIQQYEFDRQAAMDGERGAPWLTIPPPVNKKSPSSSDSSSDTIKAKRYVKHKAKPKAQESSGQSRKSTLEKRETKPELDVNLTAYAGTYSHPGYHELTVQIRDGRLFVDATDRSMGFTLTLHHVGGGTHFSAGLMDMYDASVEPIDAQFVLEDGRALKFGVDLEPVLKELIWFERVADDDA